MLQTLSLLCVIAGGTPDTSAPPVIQKQRSTLAEQGIEGLKGLSASFLVAAPPERVLEALWDVKRFPELFPDIKAMTVLGRKEREVRVRFTVDAVLAKVSYTLDRTLDPKAGAIRWREVEGGDLKCVRGAWKVAPGPEPGTSRVVYESFVDVGRFVPEGLYRELAIGKVNELAERVRKAAGG